MPTKVGVFASSHDQRQHLQTMLSANGLNVVVSEEDGEKFLQKLHKNDVDVLLIDIGESGEDELEFIDKIYETGDIPILFNDSGPGGVNLNASGENWAKKLAEKLSRMANGGAHPAAPPVLETPYPVAGTVEQSSAQPQKSPSIQTPQPATPSPTAAKVQPKAAESAAVDLNVWVLGASLGGPQAVRQFLSAIEEDLPVVFILAQHIGANHVSLLAEQLHRVTKFNVIPGRTGHQLKHHEVILTPADKQLSITNDGFIVLNPSPPVAIYSPSIDNVMSEVAKIFGKKAGTIIFSGMGDDGAKGCESIAQHGGIVWAQDIASCVVSSMPDHARKTGKVSYSANPEQLAKHLYEHYRSGAM